jgi:hypothetical protein
VIFLSSNITNNNQNNAAQAGNVTNLLSNRPVSFFQNNGQTDSQVNFYAQRSGASYFFTKDRIVFSFVRMKRTPRCQQEQSLNILNNRDIMMNPQYADMNREYMRMVFSMEFKHSNPNVQIEGMQMGSETANYFTGNDSRKWCTNVNSYEKIMYRNLWRNIDLVCYMDGNSSLKFDYVVRPGGNVEDIMLQYDGIDNLYPDEDGNLIIETPMGNFIDNSPTAYQMINGRKIDVAARYENRARHCEEYRYGFEIGHRYDPRYTLTIDPGIVYSSFIGAPFYDEATAVAVDNDGNAYVTGYTESLNFPTTNGFDLSYNGGQDAFVVKINSTPAVVYSSYLGGAGNDIATGIDVDRNGNVYVTGYTDSNAFPTLNPFQATRGGGRDGFITKISPVPAIVYSSYLGGNMDEFTSDVAVDRNGNACITGSTRSTNFPIAGNAFDSTYNGSVDAFVTKVSPSGTLIYSTYLGGDNVDVGTGIAVDSDGNIYISGTTISNNFPTRNAFDATANGNADAFVTKFNQSGSLIYSSYLGGNDNDNGRSIAVDRQGNAYITGWTMSNNFPLVNPFDNTLGGTQDAFITKISSRPAIVYSSYLGGTDVESGEGVAVDRYGNAYITGTTFSNNFPTVNPFDNTLGGTTDAFITKVDSRAQIIYSSYLGGSANENGNGIAVDRNQNAYIVGSTTSTDFPAINAFDNTYNGATDGFIAKIETPPAYDSSTMNVVAQMLQQMQVLQDMMNEDTL